MACLEASGGRISRENAHFHWVRYYYFKPYDMWQVFHFLSMIIRKGYETEYLPQPLFVCPDAVDAAEGKVGDVPVVALGDLPDRIASAQAPLPAHLPQVSPCICTTGIRPADSTQTGCRFEGGGARYAPPRIDSRCFLSPRLRRPQSPHPREEPGSRKGVGSNWP